VTAGGLENLRCASCGVPFIIANRHEYSCSSYIEGSGCDNDIRVGRASLEDDIIGPIRHEMLAGARFTHHRGDAKPLRRRHCRCHERASTAKSSESQISAVHG